MSECFKYGPNRDCLMMHIYVIADTFMNRIENEVFITRIKETLQPPTSIGMKPRWCSGSQWSQGNFRLNILFYKRGRKKRVCTSLFMMCLWVVQFWELKESGAWCNLVSEGKHLKILVKDSGRKDCINIL